MWHRLKIPSYYKVGLSQPLVPSKACTLKHIDITFQYEQKFDDLQCMNSMEDNVISTKALALISEAHSVV